MRRIRTATVTSVALLLLAASAGCRTDSNRPIRIGLLALLSGDMASASGIPSKQGAELAVADINGRGGVMVNGRARQLQLVVRDYDARPDAAATAARALINLDSVDVVIGPQFSAHAISAGGVAEDAHVPLIAPMASNPAVTAGRSYVFRLAYLDPFMGQMLATYAREDLKATRAAVLYDVATAYGRDISELFSKTFAAAGGRMVASETFTSDQKVDFRRQLRAIAATDPEVLLLPNSSAVDSFQVRQARALGIRAVFLATDIWDPPGLRHIPESRGAVYTRQWHPELDRPSTLAFTARYMDKFRAEPRSTAAMTYDAVSLFAIAASRAGTLDGTAVAKAIAGTAGFEGVTGTISYSGNGDPRRSGVLARIGAERDEIIRVVDPAKP